jgi:O-methyltransferase/aklanonic acid methyltransferase
MPEEPADGKAGISAGFGRAAATYDAVIPFFDTFAQHLVDAAAPKPAERVLDVACGRGACLRAAARRVGPAGYVLGVDLSSAMVDLARRDLPSLGLSGGSAEVRVGDAEHLELPDDSFDLVLCGFGVFFFPDPATALSECRRVLASGGRIAASTFAGGGGGYPWFGDVMYELRPATPRPPRNPVATATGLIDLLRRSGFVEATTRQVEARFLFPDVDAYLAWNWSTGARRFLEVLSDEEIEAYRRLSANRLNDHVVPGGYELIQVVDLTVGRKPEQTE